MRMANKIAKRNIKQKYLKFIRNEKRENAIKINFKNTKYTHAVCISYILFGEVCVDRALMWYELNCVLQPTRPTGRMIDAAGRNKKRVRNYAKLLCANGNLFVFTRSNNNRLSILALPLLCGY